MKTFWTILGAWWSDDATEAGLPTVGTGAGHVPTLQADNTVIWAPGSALLQSNIIELGDLVYEGDEPVVE